MFNCFKPKPRPKRYIVDWDKVKTIKDMKLILSSMYPRLAVDEDSILLEKFEHILKEDKTDD